MVSSPTFVKWAGGKSQLIKQFNPLFPQQIENYFEPFVGGGAVFFHVMQEYKPKTALISDINSELIDAYQVIRDSPLDLAKLLKQHKAKHCKEYYYKTRGLNPDSLSKTERAARFIYLNKTCFNGLYRVNSKNGFNVPMGSYKKPSIPDEEDIMLASKLLQNVKIKNMHFSEVLNHASKGDFVYMDPPYYPVKEGKSFTSYTANDFSADDHRHLAEVYGKLSKKGALAMLSNSDTPFVGDLYSEYDITPVQAKRMINSNGKGRGEVSEVVVRNYREI
ncbi:MAG TPA: DNA adenine methylase [Nanoarchaeota archaeon]|nr:DNA adenine methylase [Nanoarchaeota archaeon]